jgi:hypothetical protein
MQLTAGGIASFSEFGNLFSKLELHGWHLILSKRRLEIYNLHLNPIKIQDPDHLNKFWIFFAP